MKKILSLILAGLMTVSCAAFVAADDAAVEATDSTQAYAISFLAQNGIYHGKSNEEFVAAAADPIERYQMALFVARISTGWVDDYMWDYNYDWEDNTANNSTFTDLAGTAAESYLGAISYANQKGIIEGYSATKFGPTDGITYRDALTMVVRTMGYQGLIYPWGYIETAVELGLTEGIEGVTYTDNLNRGQVAVILYNAMFAPCKGGETLAKSIFDVDFGWETIVITSTDEGSFQNGNVRAKAGYVGFNKVDAAGNIDAKTYFVSKEDLDLAGAHADELALGYIYNALFTIDGDLATIVDADVYPYTVVVNNGRTDNAGVEVATQPIKDTLSAYTLVKERTGKEYLTFLGQELYIYEAGVYTYLADTEKALIGIEFGTNNIVKWDAETETWKTEWLYNAELGRYYSHWYDDVEETVYINWMSDEEFAEWYDMLSKVEKTSTQYVLKTSIASIDNPYAKLVMFNLDKDEAAEVALYKDYAIGYFTNDSKACGSKANNVDHSDTNKKYATYKVTTLDGVVVLNPFVEAGHEAHDTDAEAGFAWFNVAADVTGFVNEDGTYNNGTILYNYNKTTGEIEVVKYIPKTGDCMDEDSYWVSGILQAYSTKGASITIDGEKYYYGYDKLVGVSDYLKIGANNVTSRTVTAQKLDGMLMQYVEALVVDDKVVDIELINAYGNNVIVVLGYAGVTSDGYIAVYGYSTFDTGVKVYKINSYNGWKKGDYRYYPANAQTDSAFVPGTIYTIKSTDAETNSYGVYTENVEDAHALATRYEITFEKGYRIEKNLTNNEVAIAKMEAADKYIIVCDNGVIFVQDGILDECFKVTGDMYKPNGGKTIVVYVSAADFDKIDGFQQTGHEIGFVLYDKANGTVLEAAYDDAIGDFYLLGSTVSEVRVTNLLTGDVEYTFVADNIDLENGEVYVTLGNTIIGKYEDRIATGTATYDFLEYIENIYNEENVEHAKYMVEDFTMTEAGLTDVEVAVALGIIDGKDGVTAVEEKIADATINGIKAAFLYEYDATGDLVLTKIANDLSALADGEYDVTIVYTPADGKYVLYIDKASIELNTTVNTTLNDDDAVIIADWTYSDEVEDIESALKVDWAGSIAKAGDEVTKVTIDTLAIYFDTIAAEHDDIALAGYLFGMKDNHNVSHFGFNDSFIRVAKNGKEVASFRADEMLKGQFYNDISEADCGMIDLAWVTNLGLTLAEGEQISVRFFIQGNNTENDVIEGNNVEVAVAYELVDGEIEVTVYGDVIVNGATYTAGTTDEVELNSITLSLID